MNSSIKKLDINLAMIVQLSMLHLIQIGLKYGIFRELTTKRHYSDVLTTIPVRNKPLLKSLLDTYSKLGILEKGVNELVGSDFSYILALNSADNKYLLPDWVPLFEEIYKMVDYAFISPQHPKILMDFDKDADFWDMRLALELNNVYRRIIVSIGEIKDEMRVLDLGCGSISPVEIGKFLGPNGEYVGVDFSPGIISIAKQRIQNSGFDWVTLKEVDIKAIRPRTRYDIVIMSFVLEYVDNIQKVVKNAMDVLEEKGMLIIVEPFRENYPNIEAWEFFEGLTREFVEFPKKSSIMESLENDGYTYRVKELGKSILIVEKL